MDFVRLALVNLYETSPKQARQSKCFFALFFYYLFKNTNPIYKLSMAVKKTDQNKKKLSLFPRAYFEIVAPVHVEGDLIVRTCLQFGRHSLSRLFSLKPWKLRHPWCQSSIPGSLWPYIWSLRSTTHLKSFLRNFIIYEKHVRYTQGWSYSSF